MKYALAHLLHATGVATLARRLAGRRGRFVITLHDVIPERRTDRCAASQPGLTTAEVAGLLGWLRRHCNLLTPEAFVASDAPGVLITVDDGKANHYTQLLGLLERFEAPAVYFVPTQHVHDPRHWLGDSRRAAAAQWPNLDHVPAEAARALYEGLSEDELRMCAEHPLVTIGGHSVSHPRLPLCTDEQLQEELVAGRRDLEAVTGHEVTLFAYPYGDYDERVARAVAAAGYSHAFAVEPVGLGRPRLEIPRLHMARANAAYIDTKTSGLFRRPLAGRP